MCVFYAVVGIVGCQNCPGLCLCPFGRLQVLSPSVLLHSMALLAFLSFLSEFSLPTHYVTHIHHNTTGLIAFVNVFYKKWYHLMKPCKCDTTNRKHAYLCILCTPLTDLDHWMVLTNSNIGIIACPPSCLTCDHRPRSQGPTHSSLVSGGGQTSKDGWKQSESQHTSTPIQLMPDPPSKQATNKARMDASNPRTSIQMRVCNSCLTHVPTSVHAVSMREGNE